jgi:hypothetical protein
MYVEYVPNRASPPAILLRESRREAGKVVKRTLANLTAWPAERIDGLKRLLRGETLVPVAEAFAIEQTWSHGHVEAVLRMVRALGLDTLLASKRCRERDLVLAMIVERLIHPGSKLASALHFDETTLGDELGVAGADVDELYAALDWLLARQERIEKKLAARHLRDGGLALYDLSTSFYTGTHCPLARFGHDRDGKAGYPIIAYGVLTDAHGCPVGVSVYPGNTGDPTTVADQAKKLRERFGLQDVLLVGDRGMLTQTRIDALRAQPGLGWISALRSPAIRELVERGALQRSLFDQCNLAEIHSPDYPGERLVACFNPLLAEKRRLTRAVLLAATERKLTALTEQVARRTRTPYNPEAIGEKVGRIINRHKVAKHFTWTVQDGKLAWARNEQSIAREAQLDGIYVVRTSAAAERLSAADAVRSYKSLAQVEQAFRCLKGLDLRIRPIFHRTEDHVRAHILLCLLAYYVEWHLRLAWAELLFADEELEKNRATRDPVAPARPSDSARRKKAERRTSQALPVQSFADLLAHLARLGRHRCRLNLAGPETVCTKHTDLTPLQSRARALLDLYPVPGKAKSA